MKETALSVIYVLFLHTQTHERPPRAPRPTTTLFVLAFASASNFLNLVNLAVKKRTKKKSDRRVYFCSAFIFLFLNYQILFDLTPKYRKEILRARAIFERECVCGISEDEASRPATLHLALGAGEPKPMAKV